MSVGTLLQDGRFDPDFNKAASFRTAYKHGHHTAVRHFLQDGRVNSNFKDNQAFVKACTEGHHRVVEMLFNCGRINPNIPDNYPFLFACEYGRRRVVEILLKRLSVSAEMLNASFRRAVINNHLPVVKLLLAHENLGPCFNNNEVLKHVCCHSLEKTLVLFLEDFRIRHSLDRDGQKVLHLAAKHDCHNNLKLLLQDSSTKQK